MTNTDTERTWQRARSPEQKEERINSILDAARALLDEQGLDGTGLNAIARRAGLSKPNLYVYFESREAILMRLLLIESQGWVDRLVERLSPLAGCANTDLVGDVYAETASTERRFFVLFAAISSVFENNVSPDTIAAFKREFLGIAKPAIQAMSDALPVMDYDTTLDTMAIMATCAAGLWAPCHPSPAAAEALTNPDLAHLRMDFKESVRTYATAFLARPRSTDRRREEQGLSRREVRRLSSVDPRRSCVRAVC